MFEWSDHGQLSARYTNTIGPHACPSVSCAQYIKSIRIHHEYLMTVLLKIANNYMTVLLESFSVLLESIDFKFVVFSSYVYVY